jgi:hypothetical protein
MSWYVLYIVSIQFVLHFAKEKELILQANQSAIAILPSYAHLKSTVSVMGPLSLDEIFITRLGYFRNNHPP